MDFIRVEFVRGLSQNASVFAVTTRRIALQKGSAQFLPRLYSGRRSTLLLEEHSPVTKAQILSFKVCRERIRQCNLSSYPSPSRWKRNNTGQSQLTSLQITAAIKLNSQTWRGQRAKRNIKWQRGSDVYQPNITHLEWNVENIQICADVERITQTHTLTKIWVNVTHTSDARAANACASWQELITKSDQQNSSWAYMPIETHSCAGARTAYSTSTGMLLHCLSVSKAWAWRWIDGENVVRSFRLFAGRYHLSQPGCLSDWGSEHCTDSSVEWTAAESDSDRGEALLRDGNNLATLWPVFKDYI